jgi:hypothetical protein
MATVSGLACRIGRRLKQDAIRLVLVALALGVGLSIADATIVGLPQPGVEPVVLAPLRWHF